MTPRGVASRHDAERRDRGEPDERLPQCVGRNEGHFAEIDDDRSVLDRELAHGVEQHRQAASASATPLRDTTWLPSWRWTVMSIMVISGWAVSPCDPGCYLRRSTARCNCALFMRERPGTFMRRASSYSCSRVRPFGRLVPER